MAAAAEQAAAQASQEIATSLNLSPSPMGKDLITTSLMASASATNGIDWSTSVVSASEQAGFGSGTPQSRRRQQRQPKVKPRTLLGHTAGKMPGLTPADDINVRVIIFCCVFLFFINVGAEAVWLYISFLPHCSPFARHRMAASRVRPGLVAPRRPPSATVVCLVDVFGDTLRISSLSWTSCANGLARFFKFLTIDRCSSTQSSSTGCCGSPSSPPSTAGSGTRRRAARPRSVAGTATSTSFWTISEGCLGSLPPRTRRVLCST